MILLRSLIVGAASSLLIAWLFGAQAQTNWDVLGIFRVQMGDYAIPWSWPIFGILTVVVWLLQKVTRP
jgi:hypothetical protein